MASFIAEDGREIRIEMYHLTRTYGGLLEGRPPRDKMLTAVRERAVRLWGDCRPTVVREPSGDKLPEWTVYAWLGSETLADGCGSHLFLIFFVDAMSALGSLPVDVCRDELRNVVWEEKAEDWWP